MGGVQSLGWSWKSGGLGVVRDYLVDALRLKECASILEAVICEFSND